MALTNTQLLQRIVALEAKFNEMQTAMNNLASKATVKTLAAVRQQQLDALDTRVTTLESEIKILQDE